MYYINLKTLQHGIETVDHFDTYKEAKKMIKEYRLGHPEGNYYISSRCVKDYLRQS